MASHSSSQARLSASHPSAAGSGTIRLRRTNPTAFSTLPFSWPAYGLQNLVSNP